MTKPKLKFDPYSQEYFDNPYEIYRRMRDETPIYYDEDEDFYALTRHADVAAALKDHESFSSTREVPPLHDQIRPGVRNPSSSWILRNTASCAACSTRRSLLGRSSHSTGPWLNSSSTTCPRWIR